MTLVTLQEVKGHLRLTTADGSPGEADLTLKTEGAEAAVLRWVRKSGFGSTNAEAWTDATSTPADVKAAVLLMLTDLWRFRGDDVGAAIYSAPRNPGEDLPPVVIGLLRRYTDPVLA